MTVGMIISKLNRERISVSIENDPDGRWTVKIGNAESVNRRNLRLALTDAINYFKVLIGENP